MKKLRRIPLLLVTILMASTVLGGCSGGAVPEADAPASAGQPAASDAGGDDNGDIKQVFFWSWSSLEAGQTVADGFNEAYAGKYEMVYNKISNAATMTINTALASGERIDVMTQSSPVDERTRAISGNYMALNQFLEADGIDYAEMWGESIESTANFNGEYFGVPYCKNVLVTWFNKNMFDEAGVAYPEEDWTWEDFREKAAQLTSGTGGSKVYGAMFDVVGEDYAWDYIARQKIGSFYNYNEDRTATTYDRPEMKESLQFFYDMMMVDQSLMPLDEYKALQLDDDVNGMNGLYSGRYAIWIAPVYSAGYMRPSYGDLPEGTDIGMANLPRNVEADGPVTVVYTSTASIPVGVADPEASWAALRFITIDRADLWAGAKTMHPGYAFDDADALHAFNELIFGEDSGIPGLDREMAISLMDRPRREISKDNPTLQGQKKIQDLLTAELTLLFNGEQSVDECLANLKAKGDAYIAEDIAAGLQG